MTFDFAGKTVLITGAASGIGAACARAFAQSGAGKLVLVDLDVKALDALHLNCDVSRHSGDVADEELWTAVEAEGGTIDAAVVNAGIAAGAPIVEMSLADWRKTMAVNLDGAFLTLRCAMRMAAPNASIVLTASVAGIKAEPGTAAYASSKAAVIQLAKIAAMEGAAQKIRVNAIAPGGVNTPIWDGQPFFDELVDKFGGDREAALQKMASGMTPLGRFATADEIAAQVQFLCSPAASSITGSTLVCDGGYRL